MPVYAAIDLKSFYASAECVERRLDPLNTNLVVADLTRTEKTICLAVSPSLKAIGVPGRPRLFEVIQKVAQANEQRRQRAPHRRFTGKSYDADALALDPSLEIGYIVAPPQMRRYMAVSTDIYRIYLKYIAPEDIHVYSIDEVFLDLTNYLETYHCTAHELVMRIIREVLQTSGITATAGIGTNLYLAKVAMDIVAKKMPPDADGVRIAELDETGYREQLWGH
ncbi:MAG: DNA methylase, partial [Oscillospiraceae bacterium]|nr:DNA methylase [Oscillospiraceae bacterium]